MFYFRHLTPFQFKLAIALALVIIAGVSATLSFLDWQEKHAVTAEDVFIALSQGDMTRIVFCLKAKPDLANARDKNGRTPLQIAAERNMADTARLLLKMGADPALKDQEGKTAAEIAQEKGAGAVAEILRENAAGR